MLGNMMMVDNQDPKQERLRIVAQTIKRMAPLTETYFKDQTQQENFMRGIFNLLKTNDIDVLKCTLEGLIEVIKLNYVYMGRYLEELLGSTY